MPPIKRPPVPQTNEERRQLLERFIKVNNPRRQFFDGIWWSEEKFPRIKRHAAAEIELIGWTEIAALVAKAEAKAEAKPQPRPTAKAARPSEMKLAEYRARARSSRRRDQ